MGRRGQGSGALDLGPRYQPIRELGSGGMGRVLLVRDLHLRKELALKLLHAPPLTRAELEQVEREFALLAQIEHPGIAKAYDFGYLNGKPYFTAEFIPGQALGTNGVPLGGAQELLEIAVGIAEPLAYLHRGDVLHLDIKPSNVIARAPGARVAPESKLVIIDFGLCRRGGAREPEAKLMGSLPYMAPEFIHGTLGPWTDVYAVGVTLYLLATGLHPRSGLRPETLRLTDLEAWDPVPRAPSSIRPALPRELDHLILRCLAIDPESRYRSAVELLEALQRLARPSRPRRAPAPAPPTTVGRGEELLLIERFLDGLKERREAPRVLLLTGSEGMGQTHLLRELNVRALTKGIRSYLEPGYSGALTAPGSLLRCLGAHLDAEKPKARGWWERFLLRLERPGRSPRGDVNDSERRVRRAVEVARAASELREPLLLAVDDLEWWDEVSIALLADLSRWLGEAAAAERPPLAIAVAYRERGTSLPLLRELSAHLLQPGKALIITLGPLGPEETLELYHGGRGDSLDR